ncbi:MAG: hypothetical protein IKT92_03335 [Bacteroidaceae bacterium]|nr:hypothetical protein [Bacteroidaceae bacterium]
MKRLLFVLIALMGISATALAERVTAIEQIDPDVAYYIYSPRATLLYSDAFPNSIASTTGKIVTTSADPTDPNQQWNIKIIDGAYYLYNIGVQKYVGTEGNFTDTPDVATTIEKKGLNDEYPWMFSINGYEFNSQDPGQMDAGIVVSNWDTADRGNSYCIMPAADFVPAMKYDELVNGKLYTFKTLRGYMYADTSVSETDVLSTAKVSATFDKNDARFQWTVYKSAKGNYYIYNIHAEKFIGTVAVDANNVSIPLSEQPASEALNFKTSSNPDYPIMVTVNGAGVLNHHQSLGNGCINWTGGWGNLSDDGSNHKVEEVGELSSELLAAIEATVNAFEAVYDHTVPFVEAKINAITLLNSGLYLSDAAATAITAIEAITCENTEESVAAAIAEVKSIVEATAINTEEIFYVKDLNHNQYLTATTDKFFVGADERSHYAVWQFKAVEGGGYHLYEAARRVYMPETDFVSHVMTETSQDKAGVYDILFVTTEVGVVFKSKNPKASNYPYIHNAPHEKGIVAWDANAKASQWQISVVPLEHREEYHSGEDFQLALSMLEDAIEDLEDLVDKMSDEYVLGYLYSTRGNQELYDVLEEAQDFYDNLAMTATLDQVYAKAALLKDWASTVDIYQPELGHYYRVMAEDGGNAITANIATNGNRLALEPIKTNPFSSIIYITQSGYLHSFSTGQLFTNFIGDNQTLLPIGTTEGYMAKFGIGDAEETYTISFGKDENDVQMYLCAIDKTYVEGRSIENRPAGLKKKQFDWVLEEITELPIVVSPDGFATLYTPTAVKCPEGVKAYSGVINEAEGLVDLKSYPDGLIPAGTAVMIKAEASAIESVPGSDSKIVNLEVLDEATIDAQDNDFVGSYFTEEAPENICTLQMINGEMGFYRYNGTYIKGFKGYLPIPSTLGTIRFRFADGTTTDIDAATLETAPTTYYDLSGRRVLNPTRGVYVTASGKKVFVK